MASTRLRLVGTTVAAFAAISLLAGAILRASVSERQAAIHLEQLVEQAETLAAALDGARLVAPEAGALKAMADAVRARSGLRVSFIVADGSVVADSDVHRLDLDRVANHAGRPEIAAALEGRMGSSRRQSATVGRTLVYAAVPHPAGGVVRVADERPAPPPAALWLGVWATGVALAGVASWMLIRTVAGEPIARIAGAVEGLAAGDLDARTGWHAGDELGRIAAAVDRLGAELDARLREISGEKEQLQAVLSGMVEGVLVLDEQGHILLANPRLREMMRMRGDTAGKRPIEAIRNAAVEEALADAAAGAGPVVREIRLGGDHALLRVHASAFPSGEGKGVVAVFHDITEIRRVEALRRDFVTNASHELRTPLTAIRGFAETLLRNELSRQEQRRYLEIILGHSERLSRLVDDLLELSRAESASLPLEPHDLRLAGIASDVLAGLTAAARERGIDAGLRVDEDVSANADPAALEQILINLLDNAFKYTDPGGKVELIVGRAPGGRPRVRVSDTGIGIPAADRDRIFERFYRVDRARSRGLGGTGLGLSIVRHLAAAMGGEVGVESAPGVGSTFWVDLPTASSR